MRTFQKIFKIAALSLILSVMIRDSTFAMPNSLYTDPETGYGVYIEDDANLLTDSEETALIDYMIPITHYGNVGFKSVNENSESTVSFAKSYYASLFNGASGTIFFIDMDNRQIYIHSDGYVYGFITSSKANIITDNTYEMATDGDYYGCAAANYSQINTVLAGGRIAQPMKYIGNALLAMLLALVINFGIVLCFSKAKKVSDDYMASEALKVFSLSKPSAVKTNTTKRYNPQSSGSGGSSGGGGSGGGGGGGGGHGF